MTDDGPTESSNPRHGHVPPNGPAARPSGEEGPGGGSAAANGLGGAPPSNDRPAADRPSGDRTAGDRPAVDWTAGDRGGTERLTGGRPPDRTGTDRPGSRSDLVQVPQAPDPLRAQPRVRGRIDIADEVIEKVAAAAAYEVDGVAELGGDVTSALEWMRERIGIGRRRGERNADQSINADIEGREAEIDVVIVVKYGHALVDVARSVQANVAFQTNRMLGLKVLAVNVTIEDIEMPEDALSYKDDRAAGFVLDT